MSGRLRVGFACRDITPAPGIDLSGFGFRFGASLGSLEPLEVGALAVSDGDQTVLLFSLDLIGLTLEHLADLRSQNSWSHQRARRQPDVDLHPHPRRA